MCQKPSAPFSSSDMVPTFSLRPVKKEYEGIPRLEVDDVNQSKLFCASPMGSKAGMSLPIPDPHHMVSLYQSA